jgi:2-iminobutanoate/2-iminopropanoate deaminase
MLDFINDSAGVPKAVGPYSQAVRCGPLLFCSGQVPLDPETGKLVEGDIGVQTRQVMANLRALLAGQGLGFSALVKTTIYLCDMGDFAMFNAAYAQALEGHRPARATVAASGLPLGARVEIEAIAFTGGTPIG